MPSQADAKEIGQDAKVKAKRRFDARDFGYLADFVIDEWTRRKQARSTREKQWAEIDRQIAMEPSIAFKRMPNGQIDVNKVWMAEMELPFQAQALEVLTADARRMMFPDSGPWFRAHGEMTDAYLDKVDFQSFILGDRSEVPSRIDQDNCDKMVEGYLLHLFGQGDIAGSYDHINAGAFKYGMGVGRARMETKNVYLFEARGVVKEKQKIPRLVPASIKNLYLDDPLPSMHSAQVLGPAHIAEDHIKYENIAIAANKGSTDPDDEDGGWMPLNVAKVLKDDKGYVRILEIEGDLVVPRKTSSSIVLPGAIVTVALGGKEAGGNASRAVIRFRWRKSQFSSYVLHPYHYEHTDDPYPTSPLMKGRPLQVMATDAMNRLIDSAALKAQPPVSYDKDDNGLNQAGGPPIYPGAQWASGEPNSIKAHTEIGGDPAVLSAILMQAINLYAELTGVLPARVGAQTKSHTTAFAKDAEMQRGAVRTVDYVRQNGVGAVTNWLGMAYKMGRDSLKGREKIKFFIESYGGFVEITKDALPESAVFEWFGAGGPAEEAQRVQMKLQSAQLALKMDQMAIAAGMKASVNIQGMIQQTLRDGGWTDLDAVTTVATAQAPDVGLSPAVAATQTLAPRSGRIAVA